MKRESLRTSFAPSHRTSSGPPSRPAARSSIAAPAAPALANPGDWAEFTEAPSRLSAPAVIGSGDVEEKDFMVGDFDQDGDPDLVIFRKTPFSIHGGKRDVLLMNENGVMTDRTDTLAPDFLAITDDRDVQKADFDGDGWEDLVTAGTFGQVNRIFMNLGESGGVWQGFQYQAARIPTLPAGNFCSVAAGDITGDDRPDLYFTDYDTTFEDKLLINDGNGNFTDQTSARLTAAMVNSTFSLDSQIVDMNNDTFNDIVKDNASGSVGVGAGPPPNVSIMYNDGTGHFAFRDQIYDIDPYSTEVADFTQDGKMDLFIIDDSQDRYMINIGNDGQGHADFTTAAVTSSPLTNFFGGNAHFADLDNDGILDMMVADVDTDQAGCDRRLVLLRGTGTPPNISYRDPFNGANRPWLLGGTVDIAALDIDGDGALDLFIGTCIGRPDLHGHHADPLPRRLRNRHHRELVGGGHHRPLIPCLAFSASMTTSPRRLLCRTAFALLLFVIRA